MFYPPPSYAMDATAGSGGPSTMLPQIVTGSPELILAHVEQVLHKATQFASLLEQFENASQQLEKAWSGSASESALKKISDSLQAFEKIIKVVEEGASLLGISADLVRTAQTAYQSVVSAVNPTVAGLMSNPWTYGAAVALSTSTSATLRGFIQSVQGLLTALGAGRIATQISTLMTIITDIEQLFQGGRTTGAIAGGSGAASDATVSAAPLIAPTSLPQVASASGQAASAAMGSATGSPGWMNYQPAALSTGSATMAPSTGQQDASWIAVDPPARPTPSGHAPAAGPASTSGEVTFTTTKGDITTKVEVPAGHDVDVSLDVTVDGQHVTEHGHVAADGTVTVG